MAHRSLHRPAQGEWGVNALVVGLARGGTAMLGQSGRAGFPVEVASVRLLIALSELLP